MFGGVGCIDVNIKSQRKIIICCFKEEDINTSNQTRRWACWIHVVPAADCDSTTRQIEIMQAGNKNKCSFLFLKQNVFLALITCVVKMDLRTAEEINLFCLFDLVAPECLIHLMQPGSLQANTGDRMISHLMKWHTKKKDITHSKHFTVQKGKWNIDWQFHGRLFQQLPTESWPRLFPGEQTGLVDVHVLLVSDYLTPPVKLSTWAHHLISPSSRFTPWPGPIFSEALTTV